MMNFVKIIFVLISLNAMAKVDITGHHRFISSTFYGGIKGHENSPNFSQVLLNNRVSTLYTFAHHTFEMAYVLFTSYNHYEVSLLQSELEKQHFKYRVKDFDYYLAQHKLLGPDSYSVIQNLDRFFYQYSEENFDIKLGRQPVAFGSARIVNPLDVLVPFNLTMINFEQKIGVDAVHGRYSFSEMGMIELGSVFDKDTAGKDQFHFVSIADTFLNESVDLKLLYATLKQNLIRGLDIQASIYGWGTWLEYGFFTTKNKDEFKRYSIGGEYIFQNNMTFFFEYHFNEAGVQNSKGYSQAKKKAYASELAIYLFGREYFNFGGSYTLTPLKTFSLSVMSNLNDGSKLFSPAFDYNFKEDWTLQLGGFYGEGQKGLNGSSEFGSYPKAIFFNVKNYF